MFRDQIGQVHVRLDQIYHGLPVYGQQVIVHLDRDGSPLSATGTYWSDIALSTEPRLSVAQAAAIARDLAPGPLTAPPDVSLALYPHEQEVVLAYLVVLEDEDAPRRVVVFVDAVTGKVIHSFNDLHTFTGVGHSLYSGAVSITTSQPLRVCEPPPSPGFPGLGSENPLPFPSCPYMLLDRSRGLLRTVDRSTKDFFDPDNIWGDGTIADPATVAVDAHFGAEVAFDYFLKVHGRRGMFDDGRGPRVRVHVQEANARWGYDCQNCLTFGDGGDADRDGIDDFGPMVPLDIVAHEMTHGVTAATAGLIYNGESGGLNEAISDIFGTMVKFFAADQGVSHAPNYQYGEDVCLRGGAIRYLDRPTRPACFQFCRSGSSDVSGLDYYTGALDSAPIHCSSGIPNNAFYLLAEGGTHRKGDPVIGIGRKSAEKIFYRALAAYMTPSETFADAKRHTLLAAEDLFGPDSPEAASLCQAWTAVGVTEGPCRTCPTIRSCDPQSVEQRFRSVNDYAGRRGYAGGFPNFHEAAYGGCRVFGTLLLKGEGVHGQDVSAAELGDPKTVEERFRAVNDWAGAHGYFGGFPNFHQADYGQGTVYGVILFKPGVATWMDIPARELSYPVGVEERFRAVNDWAGAHGYFGGFPNFHQADYGGETVYGAILFTSDAVEGRDVPANGLPCG